MTLTATTFPGLDPLLQSGVIAVVRLTEAVRLGPAARALAAGGVGAVEVTLTTPGAIDAIADLASDQGLAGCVIGAGTVLDESAARSVIDAGARFVVSPALDPSVIRACRDRAVPCMPGAFTPTELVAASRAGPPVEERVFESSDLVTWFGGAEGSVAAAVSRFGVRCDYVTRVPDNPIGHAGVAALEREGVGTEWIQRGGERLGIYFVEPGADLRAMRVVYDRAGSALARIEPRAVDWPRVLAGADWFHASGITPALGDGPAAVLADAIARARAQRIPVSFDLNYREALWRDRDPRPLVEPLVRQATLLIANPTAVRAMLGIDADETSLATPDLARELAQGLAHRCGVKRVALTRRELLEARRHGWSAVLYDADSRSFAQSRRHCVEVVDRVGGGDSFAAGLIARLLGGAPPARAVEFAVARGGAQLTVPGDFSRASVQEVEELLRT